ncbi:MAG: M20 family metallopeptidase [Anaerovorax sp.]|nr:M20 family metallopeptidase [Anaerovorax sp.]
MNIKETTKNILNEIIKIRRDFHMYPELSEQEFETAKKICDYLKEWGIEYKNNVGGTGIVAIIKGKRPGKTIAIKSDMDALPIQEKNDVLYKSKNDGVMHACGHDVNTAILLGTARVLKKYENEIKGNIKFFFEPAEETIGGATLMIKDGCMEKPSVDVMLGMHVMPYLNTGDVEIRYGCLNASSNEIKITVHGKSGHAASPEKTVDPIVVASHIVIALQTLVSRSISPTDSAVLTIGKIQGGTKGNIIPEKVELQGTLRVLYPEVKKYAKIKINEIATHIALAMGATAEVEIKDSYNALINDTQIVNVINEKAVEILGSSHVIKKETPSMGAEDFSYYLEKAQGAYYHLGCRNKEKDYIPELHTERFDVDEDCIGIGIELQTKIVMALLNA